MTLFVYDVLYALPLSLILTYVSSGVLYLYAATPFTYVLTALFAVYFAGIVSAGRWVRLSLVLLLILGVLLPVLIIPEKSGTAAFISQNLWVLWCFLTALLAFLAERILSRFLYAKLALATLLLLGMAAAAVLNYVIPGPAVAIVLFFVLCASAEAVRTHSLKKAPEKALSEDRPVHAYMAYLSPFLIIMLLYTSLYKAPDEPYGWEFAKRIYADVSSAVDRMNMGIFRSRSESYEDAEVGFSERSLFPGSVSNKGREVMYLTGSSYRPEQVYLSGKVFSDFNGRTWDASVSSSENGQLLDYIETRASVFSFDPERTYDYLHSAYVVLEYRFFSSSHIFHPQKVLITGNALAGIGFRHEGANLIANRRITYRDAYRVDYLRLNRSNPDLEALLQQEKTLSKEEWDRAVEDAHVVQTASLEYGAYLSYRSEQRRIYGEAPVLSGRTSSWLEKTVGEEKSAYKKALRIASALKKMQYDSSPGPLPQSVRDAGDFLDWFLFEGKRGYCNHFATALTLLCRASGIPARYVQGYVTDVSTERTMLLSDRAHSWCEILIPGFGWLTMDATPGYGVDSSWAASSGGSAQGSMLPDDDEDDGTEIEEPSKTEDPDEKENEEKLEKERRKKAVERTVFILLGSALLAVSSVLLAKRVSAGKRYRRSDPGEKLRILSKRNVRLLSSLNLKPEKGETLSEYALRASSFTPSDDPLSKEQEELLQKLHDGYPLFTESLERFLFADMQPSDEEVERSEELNDTIQRLVRTYRPFAGALKVIGLYLKE
ncbi:MAG: transglutaminase domain-containing protein [Lachnospiraceae bacterium]|nr:transglutaminase domain-containing protein [Lachnospiraceae bacterium]